jgi:predicted DsbA family dithiol-disulfide isomerase
MGAGPEPLDVHVDLMCPFAFQTSLGLRDLVRQGIVSVRWRFFSLDEVNRPADRPHPWDRPWA